MSHIINSTTTRTQGWQADCWNWAKANKPFELHGVQTQHLPFCEALSAACHCQFYARQFHNESIATFEPGSSLSIEHGHATIGIAWRCESATHPRSPLKKKRFQYQIYREKAGLFLPEQVR